MGGGGGILMQHSNRSMDVHPPGWSVRRTLIRAEPALAFRTSNVSYWLAALM
jgi:hypothetical protein